MELLQRRRRQSMRPVLVRRIWSHVSLIRFIRAIRATIAIIARELLHQG
jgi:hypothetical protein